MSVSVALLGAMAVLYACGVYLLLEKSVTRIILGILLIGNATNLLLLALAGPPGAPPIAGSGPSSDPLPQALILTAIVITFAVSAFLMALVYRSWRIAQEDRLERDEADVAVGQGDQPETEAAAADEESEFDRPGGTG
ncbi:Na(+)/H(+) antiporter subunit C [Amnibacterium soli]|uniref:Na(+)/H(+) antiporter subunit C n=1 Tax=Amnibacterium soli TaxID=1282736 RepID=A0ABP8Z375_9MICO